MPWDRLAKAEVVKQDSSLGPLDPILLLYSLITLLEDSEPPCYRPVTYPHHTCNLPLLPRVSTMHCRL